MEEVYKDLLKYYLNILVSLEKVYGSLGDVYDNGGIDLNRFIHVIACHQMSCFVRLGGGFQWRKECWKAVVG